MIKKKLLHSLLAVSMLVSVMSPATVYAQNFESFEMGNIQSVETDVESVSEENVGELVFNAGYVEPVGIEVSADVFGAETLIDTESIQKSAYWASMSSTYYYNQLSSTEKAFWNNMDAICSQMLEGTTDAIEYDGAYFTAEAKINQSLDSTSAKRLVTLFKYSNPQYYFLDGYYVYSSGNPSYLALGVYPVMADGSDRAELTDLFKQCIDLYIAEIPTNVKPEEKSKAIHDLLVANIDYVENPYDQSALSAIGLSETVCAGYTLAYTLLGNASGLNVIPVLGNGHAWNKINLHGTWYNVDATWDDQVTYIHYGFYNKSDASLDAEGGHVEQTIVSGYYPASVYDSTNSWTYYNPAYFAVDGNTYFKVNDNTSLAARSAILVEAPSVSAENAAPASVTYDANSYTVVKGGVENFVRRMYTVALGRSADTNGLAYWVRELTTGNKDGATVAKGFILSSEMTNLNLSDDAYLTRLYQTFFNRTPASGDSGKAFWANLLNNGVTRAYVFKGFCHSAEFETICNNYGITRGTITLTENRDKNHNVTMYVYRCYKETLGRTPDASGLNYWTGVINNKQRTPIDVAGNFVFSSEFKAKNLSDSDYVKVLYRMFFGREYDTNGYNFWMGELTSGRRDRYTVFTQFANSAEFKAILAQFGL